MEKIKFKCSLCGKETEIRKDVYNREDRTTPLCKSCALKLHRPSYNSELRKEKENTIMLLEEAKTFINKKLLPRDVNIKFKCEICGELSIIRLGVFAKKIKSLCKGCSISLTKKGFSKEKLKRIKEKTESTCLSKYGVTNGGASTIAKEKQKETMIKNYGSIEQGYRHNREVAKGHYEYNEIWFDSSWELAYYLWAIANGKQVSYHPHTNFRYMSNDNKWHNYTPDFLIDGVYYDTKGDQFFNEKGEPFNKYRNVYWWELFDFMKNNNIVILRWNDMKKQLKYIEQNFGKTFLKEHKKAPVSER